jgi:hypothetical protein
MLSVVIYIDYERKKKRIKNIKVFPQYITFTVFYDKQRHRQTPFVQQWTLTSTPVFLAISRRDKSCRHSVFSLL